MSLTKQSVIKFPTRKTRSISRKLYECDIENQPQHSPTKKDALPNVCVSPKNLREICVSPTRNLRDICVSPTKKRRENEDSENIINKLNLNFPIIRLERTPLKNLTYSPHTNSPKKGTTPFKNDENPFANSPKRLITSTTALNDVSQSVPIKMLNFSSPVRKSPRKLLICNSPSSLISGLNLASPKNEVKIGLHRAEIKAYQSLKRSFACNFNNRLVGRESEYGTLKTFLQKHVENGLPGSLYISGAPGTGKTASVMKLMDELKHVAVKQIFLNCMTSKSSKEIFGQISSSLNLKCPDKGTIQAIEKALTSSKVPIVIILDEVDQLESKDQKVLYTLFEWPSLAKSKLVLIGIANMLDLTDRILPRLEASHTCRPQLLHFPPYSKMEIVNIICERIKEADLGETQIIKPSAIHFLAGKVSAIAGDIRKAFDVCRRAVELCEIEIKKQTLLFLSSSPSKSPRKRASALKQVGIPEILTIFNEIYGSKVISEISGNQNSLPLQQKVLISSLLLILKNTKLKSDISLGKFHEVYSRVCRRQKLPSVEQSEFFSLCTLLESRGMLHVKKNKELRNSKIILRLNQEEAELALGDRALLATILEDKSCLANSRI